MDDSSVDALFTSDLAVEVRAEFVERARFGVSVADASASVVERFRSLLGDPNDGPVIIVCLAALQLDHGGAVQPLVRDAAVDLINSGAAARAWRADDVLLRRSRDTLLHQLADELQAAPALDGAGSQTAE